MLVGLFGMLLGLGLWSNADAKVGDHLNCPAGSVCIWRDDTYNGPMKVYGGNEYAYNDGREDKYSNNKGTNDTASSVCNRTNMCVRFYWHSGWKFANFPVPPGLCLRNLNPGMASASGNVFYFNDQVSSHARTTEKVHMGECRRVYP
jgi:hypothetical protein